MDEQDLNYSASVHGLKLSYIDFPHTVSIETFSKCNAACDFCPYPKLERRGQRMSMELIDKIIADLQAIPSNHPFTINLSRVNEPFLDSRLLDICSRINQELPQANLIFFSNSTPITQRHLERMALLRNVKSLVISFNDHRPEEYRRVMGLDYGLTMEKLDMIHRAVETGQIRFPVSLSRVGDGSAWDAEFLAFCRGRFNQFSSYVGRRSDWMGSVFVAPPDEIPDSPCAQWFKLHFLANGDEAFCCIDATGRFGTGNVADVHALDIYNQPGRRGLRMQLPSRRAVNQCMRCTMLA